MIQPMKEQLCQLVAMSVWGLSLTDRNRIISIIRETDKEHLSYKEIDSLRPLKRAEAAKMFGLTAHALDRYAREGLIKRVYMREGGKRSAGFDRESVIQFLKKVNSNGKM